MVRSPLVIMLASGRCRRVPPKPAGMRANVRLTSGGTASSPFGSRPHVMAGVAHPSEVMLPVRSSDVVLVYPARTAAARSAVNQGGSVNGGSSSLAHSPTSPPSVEDNCLAPREFTLARMAGLIVMDALPAAYLANAEASILPEER